MHIITVRCEMVDKFSSHLVRPLGREHSTIQYPPSSRARGLTNMCYLLHTTIDYNLLREENKQTSDIPTHQQLVGVGLHYQLPIWVDTSRLLASHNYNTPTAGRRGATLSATCLGGHLTFTSTTQLQHTNSR